MKKALLLYPEFSPFGFWNYKDVCELMGARYPAAPLGLITLAALLPADWDIRLIDLNVTDMDESAMDWADLVFIGGMLPQQGNFLHLVEMVHRHGKKVVAGGPDPTSQPEIYQSADYLVLGEAESSLPPFLKDMESGTPRKTYIPECRPDIRQTPIPRFDLLDLGSYLMIGVQFCRGCPFNCEFCDIIELYGRVPRTKTPEQVVAELERLYSLGYRGHIDFVDDNFIANKKQSRNILKAVKEWSHQRKHPFFYSTEASIDLADDDELLGLMKDVDFRYVFIGIETGDEQILKNAQKKQNLGRDLVEDLYKIYRHGIVVNAGFIVGFDGESRESARQIVEIVERGKICMAMIGLLYALPNTQLTRRLEREKRLFSERSELKKHSEISVDQATSGINFITRRPRAQIIEDFVYIIDQVYDKKKYFDRVLALSEVIEIDYKFKPSPGRIWRYVKGFFKLVYILGIRPSTAYHYWRNLVVCLFTKPSTLENTANLMAMYIHFRKQTKFIVRMMTEALQTLHEMGEKNFYHQRITGYALEENPEGAGKRP